MSAKPGDGIADCALMWYVWGRILIIGCHERMRMQKFGESTVMELEILRPLAQSGKKSAPYLNVLEKKTEMQASSNDLFVHTELTSLGGNQGLSYLSICSFAYG